MAIPGPARQPRRCRGHVEDTWLLTGMVEIQAEIFESLDVCSNHWRMLYDSQRHETPNGR